jgi:hypothetical protein
MSSQQHQVSFEFIKSLVAELESTVVKAHAMKAEGGNKVAFALEISKAVGLASTISGEGIGLVGDLQKLMVGADQNQDALPNVKSILGKVKGFGGTN